jgi:DNA-binding NtrC family response regulator
VCQRAHLYARSRTPLLITGGLGTGKLAVAKAIHEIGARGRIDVVDAVLAGVAGRECWLRSLQDHLSREGSTVVVRHPETLDRAGAAALAATMDAQAGRARVICTCVSPDAACAHLAPPLRDRLQGGRIHIPSLAERTADIRVIAAALVRDRWGAGARLPESVMGPLTACRWDGNVRQLRAVVHGLVEMRDPAELEPEDLPEEVLLGAFPRHLDRIERLRVGAAADALRLAGGNRSTAARMLGVSRSTLYRWLSAYHGLID